MYHYVRWHRADLPHFRYLDADDFARQLDHLIDDGGVLSREALLSAMTAGEPVPGHVLTFDDGLTDHAEVVTPMLTERGLWGIFYVPTRPLVDGTVLDVHRVHLLLGRLGASELRRRVQALLAGRGGDDRDDGDPERWAHRYTHQDDAAAADVKRILNYQLTDQTRSQVLDALVAEEWGAPLAAADVYASAEQLRAMQDAGMLIGSHSASHPVMSRLHPDNQAQEIEASFTCLDDLLGRSEVRTWCHPYGGDSSFDSQTEAALDAAGCRFSFSVEPRDVTTRDLQQRRQALPRHDCNRLPHGRSTGG